MVLHPRNPYIPTVHLNYRYFQAGPVWWFGGGADLTPYYPFLADARHFHRTLEGGLWGSVDPAYYPVFKPWCDEYFFLKHRGETRGVGGIFFDYQDPSGALYKGPDAQGPLRPPVRRSGRSPTTGSSCSSLASACGNAFLPSYVPIAEKRQHTPTAIGSGSSSSTAGAATWNSTWSSTGARSSASRPMAAPNPS
jgi:coproporphyrinogen III oxidase